MFAIHIHHLIRNFLLLLYLYFYLFFVLGRVYFRRKYFKILIISKLSYYKNFQKKFTEKCCQ